VAREYYINDAGRQMDILTASVWLRYLERAGAELAFPSNGYRGDYVRAIADALAAAQGAAFERPLAAVLEGLPADAPAGDKEKHIDALIERMRTLLGAAGFDAVLEFALATMLADIRDDLAGFGVEFERWYSERALVREGAIGRALARLEQQGNLYRKDGATWFRASAFGDDEDRVVVRENGTTTYFASDIAYHLEKRERGFQRLIDVLGADHHGYVNRLRAVAACAGDDPDYNIEILIGQLVKMFKGGEEVRLSKRTGAMITLEDLVDEVGVDAARYTLIRYPADSPLTMDLTLAKEQSDKNPVYYVQYAHARICSVLQAWGGDATTLVDADLAALDTPAAQALMLQLARYPDVLAGAAQDFAPHDVVFYLRELAASYHSYYDAERILVDDENVKNARLALVAATAQVLHNGLSILGVSAPVRM